MSAKVSNPPALGLNPDLFYSTTMTELSAHARRINTSLQADGSEQATGPILLKNYTVAGVPSASKYKYGLIYVTGSATSHTIAYSDGTNWRWVANDAIVS